MLKRLLQRAGVARLSECTALRVIETRRLTPHMQRITFSAASIDAFATNSNLHVRLLLPPPGTARDDWLVVRPNGKATLRSKGISPIVRVYTIRAIDPAAGRLDMDFVLHADGGPGGAWAAQARPGDLAGMVGPGGRGLSPADWYLIAGDETALPAIGRMLDAIPERAKGQIIVEIAGPEEEQPLAIPPGLSLRWLHRDGAPSGTTDFLVDAIKGVEWPGNGIRPFVWVAGEFVAAQQIRDHLSRDRGLPKAQQFVVAYWRRSSDAIVRDK